MKKVLIIQTSFIGDVILATSFVETIHRQFPEAEIDFVLRKGNEGVFDEHPFIRKVHIWDKSNAKYKKLCQLIKALRNERYDYIFNLQRHYASAILTLLIKGKNKIGFRTTILSLFYNQSVGYKIDSTSNKHEIERNFEQLKSLKKFSFSNPEKPKIYPQSKHFPQIDYSIPFYVIAPASVWFTKQLPVKKWVELCNRLPSESPVYFIGSRSDVELCNQIIEISLKKEKMVNYSGKLSLMESAALISKATMTYCNDSAPMHLASATNSPVTAYFCSTLPEFGFGPLSEKSKVIEINYKLNCRPCGLHGKKSCPKGHFKCGNEISIL
jgi:heptosyltransferase-2